MPDGPEPPGGPPARAGVGPAALQRSAGQLPLLEAFRQGVGEGGEHVHHTLAAHLRRREVNAPPVVHKVLQHVPQHPPPHDRLRARKGQDAIRRRDDPGRHREVHTDRVDHVGGVEVAGRGGGHATARPGGRARGGDQNRNHRLEARGPLPFQLEPHHGVQKRVVHALFTHAQHAVPKPPRRYDGHEDGHARYRVAASQRHVVDFEVGDGVPKWSEQVLVEFVEQHVRDLLLGLVVNHLV
mmetsp:Transcript_68071/g.215354  ORF Transcript_68071/g.215354 Transcript_68071/m.215354 type:complete len:240 (-) Transcript_68071:104-823(-)